MKEVWTKIIGYEGLYWVSSTGRVKNFSGKILKQCNHSHGYLQISLRQSMKNKTHAIHRLVLSSFVKKPDGMAVNHKDGNKKNNTLENLEWVTYKQNSTHAYSMGLSDAIGENVNTAVLTERQVKEIRRRAKSCSIIGMAKEYGVDRTTIGRIINGKSWKHLS